MKFLSINLYSYQSNIKLSQRDHQKTIWDPIRKKYLILTPEEWVRQLTLSYLVETMNYNANRIRVEKKFSFNQLNRRFDILVYNQQLNPWMLVECKSPEVTISQKVFDQVLAYNYAFQLEYLLVTNGTQSISCQVDLVKKSFSFLDKLPNYQ